MFVNVIFLINLTILCKFHQLDVLLHIFHISWKQILLFFNQFESIFKKAILTLYHVYNDFVYNDFILDKTL